VPDKWHTAKGLFADAYLPCATHGKEFVVDILAFAMCRGTPQKSRFP